METLLKQNIDKNNFNIFIRDLSINLNINLKHIIEDSIIKNQNENKVIHNRNKVCNQRNKNKIRKYYLSKIYC